MIHHLSLPVSDLERSAAFYDSVLLPLGYAQVWIHEVDSGYVEAAVGYGLPESEDEFAVRLRTEDLDVPGDGFHIAFGAPSREAVDEFYQAAIKTGGQDNGGCGNHPEYGPDYYAAFVFDPDGYRIEAVLDAERATH
ncbi:MAG: VOC family protein [Verrucomicrobiales bacterium]|nr:VOC family protein [Verrucomicrobiales bacterium]